MSIYQWCDPRLEYIEIKFLDSISTDTLINANFALFNATTATPAEIANPFLPINVIRDFYSISRTLRLWFSFSLASFTAYQLKIDNLKTVINIDISSDTFTFETEDISLDVAENLPPSRVPVDVEDYSIKNIDTFIPVSIPADDEISAFEISVLSPGLDMGYYLASTAAEGRIDIQFNQSPAANYVTSDYFKVQRKLISRDISRWESVSALITADTVNNFIYIYLPSNDDIPLYGEPDKVYWEPGYKYRVKILSGIGV